MDKNLEVLWRRKSLTKSRSQEEVKKKGERQRRRKRRRIDHDVRALVRESSRDDHPSTSFCALTGKTSTTMTSWLLTSSFRRRAFGKKRRRRRRKRNGSSGGEKAWSLLLLFPRRRLGARGSRRRGENHISLYLYTTTKKNSLLLLNFCVCARVWVCLSLFLCVFLVNFFCMHDERFFHLFFSLRHVKNTHTHTHTHTHTRVSSFYVCVCACDCRFKKNNLTQLISSRGHTRETCRNSERESESESVLLLKEEKNER